MSAKPKSKAGLALDFLPDADEMERKPLPRFARIGIHVLALGLFSGILTASFYEIDQVVVARGKLINPTPNVIVQPFETAVVQKIEVRVGQTVKKGDLLATLDPTFSKADEAQLRTRLRSLETQSRELAAGLGGAPAARGTDADGRLQAQLATERKANYEAQRTKLEETRAKLQAGLQTNRQDQRFLAARVTSLREIEAMQEKLVAQQYGARLQLLEAQEKRMEVERDLQMSKNREIELNLELAAFEAEKAAFDKGWRQKQMEDLLATTRERDGLNEQISKADLRSRLVNLVAPVDGVVLEIAKLSAGSIAREAEPFFTLVPLNAALEAEVQIDSLDVGYIKLGQPVKMKLDAFPFQKHGSLKGSVRNLSQDAFQRNTAQADSQDAYYQGRIQFGDARLQKMAAHARLLPGMTISAEVVVGRRTVMSYLLWPLTKALNESNRGP